MSQPSVCAILLTADRPEYTRKAVQCFRAQTYENKRLIIYETSLKIADMDWWDGSETGNETLVPAYPGKTIGELRNAAAANIPTCAFGAEIIVTWDSDDYSHPSRISEQVALLQSSQADVVGFSDLLFWREPIHSVDFPARTPGGCDLGVRNIPGEAWLYTSPGPKQSPPGTTLCYTREFWSRNPFPATSQGEELQFLSRAKVETVSSFPAVAPRGTMTTMEPRMIARIHPGAAGNTSTAYEPKKMLAESKRRNPAWRRTPEWDQYCQSVMARSAA